MKQDIFSGLKKGMRERDDSLALMAWEEDTRYPMGEGDEKIVKDDLK